MFTKAICAVAFAGAMLSAVPAQAVVIPLTSATNSATWDSSGTGAGWAGWSAPTVGGIGVTAYAFSAATATATPTNAYLGRYVSGLGVSSSSSDDHFADNIGSYDFIALVFSQAVRLTDIPRVKYATSADAWVSYMNAGDTWNNIFSRGGTVFTGSNGVGGAVSNNFSTVWFVGAARTATSRDDGFKLTSIVVTTVPAVPEPTTWMTMILGFGAVGATLRRRRAVARVTYA